MTRIRAALRIAVMGACTTAALRHGDDTSLHAEAARCRMLPGSAHALVRVERDTVLPFAPIDNSPLSSTSLERSPDDSLVATPGTPMPAARVRLLQLDTVTRRLLAARGVPDSMATAWLRAAPYRADCRVVRSTDTVPFTVNGEVGYVRGTLAPPEQWVDGAPVLVVRHTWDYPYPRKRGLLPYTSRDEGNLTPPTALLALDVAMELPRVANREEGRAAMDARSARARAWAASHPVAAELEPARTWVRRAVIEADWPRASAEPSRLRGSYRVEMASGDERSAWYFRTHERPGYAWAGRGATTVEAVLASPHVAGYRLVGAPAASYDSLATTSDSPRGSRALAWLATDDRPTVAGNDERRALVGMLEFTLSAAPERLWDVLEPFVPPQTEADSTWRARANRPLERGQKQPVLPLTLRIGDDGSVRADTTLVANGRTLRVTLARMDTISIRRPF